MHENRLMAIIEDVRIIDKIYGITEEERHVLDVIRGVDDLEVEKES